MAKLGHSESGITIAYTTHIQYMDMLTLNVLNCFKDYKKYIHILNYIFHLACPK